MANYLNNMTYTTRTLYKTVGTITSEVFTCDNAPVENSNNPITSGAVYTLIGDLSSVTEVQSGNES